MAVLVSPGVSISVIDQSLGVGAGPGTVPLIFIATQENKSTPEGDAIAPGTRKENAGLVWSITSQRDLVQTFGDPVFYQVSGTSLNGYPLNEYGLLAAYSFLGVSNLARVVRVDIDTAQLQPSAVEPTSPAAVGTYWFDQTTTGSKYGLFQRSGTFPNEVWLPVTINFVYNFSTGITNSPPPTDGVDGNHAVVFQTTAGDITYWVKSAGTWTRLETSQGPNSVVIQQVWPDLTSLSTSQEYWIKTTAPAQGANIVLRRMNTFGQFSQVEAPILPTDASADVYYSSNPAGSAGQVFIRTFVANSTPADYISAPGATSLGNVVTIDSTADVRVGMAVSVTAGIGQFAEETTVLSILNATDFVVSATPTVALSGGSTVVEFYTHNGFVFKQSQESSNDWNVMTTVIGSPNVPVQGPDNGQLWFNAEVGVNGDGLSTVDILIADGQGSWQNINLPGFTTLDVNPGQPTLYAQTLDPKDNVPPVSLEQGDIWVDTDVQPYPAIRRWNGTVWTEVDLTDQTTPNGIIFTDARSNPMYMNGINTGTNNGGPGNPDLDPDAPDADLYPKGFMLWNTRYSTNVVKQWQEPYVFNGVEALPDDTNNGSLGRWVNVSGNNPGGAPYMGAAAQNIMIVRAIQGEIISNEEIRAEDIFFNLIAAPGYVEAIDEMLVLNEDRKETAFVVGDTPFNLPANGTAIQRWATNAGLAFGNGPDGLVSASKYAGVWYPSGLATNVDGTDVVVPPSHMALRTIAYNDQVAYPWFAPAGLQRGIVNNAAAVGYVNETGQFTPVRLNEGQRDLLYINGVNPIRVMPQGGIVIFGQKTRQPFASATDRINVVRLENYLRYQLDQLAQPFLFEPNDSTTRKAVKESFDRFLSELITLRALFDFLVVCDLSNNTPARIDRNELWIDVAIQPVKAIEFIYIPIRIRNTGSDLAA